MRVFTPEKPKKKERQNTHAYWRLMINPGETRETFNGVRFRNLEKEMIRLEIMTPLNQDAEEHF